VSGHGHVTPNADGSKARCGGPALCRECALELSRNPMVNAATLERLNESIVEAEKQAAYQTDPAWGARIVADAVQLDEIRRLGT
jgi:hypothetical protein